MTRDDIVRWFRRFQHDPEFRDESTGSRTVPIVCLCDFAGVAPQNVYMLMRDEIHLTKNYEQRLTYAIQCVEAGLRFTRKQKIYRMVGDFDRLPRYELPLPKRKRAA